MALPHTRVVSFGDCDPAGIVYYPNIFRWLDATFHVQLRPFGGHGAVCAQLGSVGLGLVDVSAQFRSPLRDGDHLTILPRFAQWGRKTLTLEYEGKVGERLAFTGQEVRCVFKTGPTEIFAGKTAELMALLEGAPG